jgi:predicted DNA-binding transcriptional regulator AlpA
VNHLDEARAISESELARQANISTAVLRMWRRQGKGPRYVKLGRLVRYLNRDVDVWLNQHAVDEGCRRGGQHESGSQ